MSVKRASTVIIIIIRRNVPWNPKKCAVAHFKRGVRVPESTGLLMSDGNVKIPTLEDGQQYKFLGVLETLRQEEKSICVGCL